jgi:DNA-binding transcriptional LysR family regulator
MLENIQAFVTVVEQKSFAKAARKLAISTPVITRRVVKLEQEVGVLLLQRTTRHLSLTEPGERFYIHSLEILDRLAAAKEMALGSKAELKGKLKIGMPASISSLYFIPALNSFMKDYPELSLQIVHGNHLSDLLGNGFDAVVHCGDLPDSSFYYAKIGKWNKFSCASPQYLKKHGIPTHPSDLKNHNCLDHGDNYLNGWAYQVDGKMQLFPISGNVSVNDSLDLKQLAVDGLGLVYLPSFTVDDAVKSKALTPVLQEYMVSALGIYILYPSRNLKSKKLEIFIELLKKIFKC